MSSLRYKTLLSYLPGMASVVNTFESPQVQNAVYEKLMEALEAKLQTEGIGMTSSLPKARDMKRFTAPEPEGEIAHDLVEGESIHGGNSRGGISQSVML